LIATGSLRATWLPEGNEFLYNLKISYETIYILMFLVCSQTQLHFFLFKLLSENRGRDDSRSFLVFYEYLPMVWRSLCLLPVLPDRRSGPLREGRCSRYGSALFFSHTDFSGTNAHFFCLFYLLPFFSIEISTENNRHRSLHYSVFYIW
jgi:hypothetical protein